MCRDDAQVVVRDATCGVKEWRNLNAGKRAPRSEAAMPRFNWLSRLQACRFLGKVAGHGVICGPVHRSLLGTSLSIIQASTRFIQLVIFHANLLRSYIAEVMCFTLKADVDDDDNVLPLVS